MKILLADDETVSRKIIERGLERAGFSVTCVDDGQAAADCLLAPDGPRIAILDWVMPGKDGPTVCREVRARAGHPYIYLMLLTSRDEKQDIVIGLEAGADDYLTKPCNPEELRARIRSGKRILDLQDKLVYEALHDPLTKLPNRAFFFDRMSECARRAADDPKYQSALLFVDIDRFKTINDSFGHLIGDELMRRIGRRLQESVRSVSAASPAGEDYRRDGSRTDLVARIGGDEFVILLDNFAAVEDGIRVAERVQETLKLPFLIAGHPIFVTASIGISTTAEATDAEGVIRGADTAMYRAKVGGKARYEISDPDRNAAAAGLLRLDSDLRRALTQHQFELHYQPIISLTDGRMISLEALLRWRHPELGLIAPGAFIPATEQNGQIIEIGAWVLHEACRQMREWHTQFPAADPVSVCINISPRQFELSNLVDAIRNVLGSTELDPRCLELELTENIAMGDPERATQILRELNGVGVSISIDDFGTGYSSLAYLQRFPLNTLKIDRSFISQLEYAKESPQIVQTIISLGHNLGMRVIAEGVETVAQMQFLNSAGCDLAQGYLFSRPVEARELARLLDARAHGGNLFPSLPNPARYDSILLSRQATE